MIIFAAALLVVSQQSGTETATAFQQISETGQENRQTVQSGGRELQFEPATPERAREFVRMMFDRQDKDASGYIEQEEGPKSLVIVDTTPSGKAQPLEEGNVTERFEGDAAWERFLADNDTDGDRRVSHGEFAHAMLPQFLERGIPVLPADWQSRQ